MNCENCGASLIAGKQFCHSCGHRILDACPGCGAAVSTEHHFCPDCGLALNRKREEASSLPPTQYPTDPSLGEIPLIGQPEEWNRQEAVVESSDTVPVQLAEKIRATKEFVEGERKLVTVLFSDIAGSTAIAEKLDPEEYRELLDQYVALAFHEIYHFEGIVNQLAGDGIMALFGAPIAHEDAPERAIRAAIGVQRALDDLDRKLRQERGIELKTRIGIHTGPVVVGNVGNDLKMDYTAIGDTTNLASRLESLAIPGSILISEETYRLVRGHFELEERGPFDVKGKSEAVQAYAVVGEHEDATEIEIAAERGLTPFVGRDGELAQLMSCFDRAREFLPQVVTMVGDTGSGRSRMLYEFKERIADEGIIFEARCSALNQTTAYYPWAQILRQYFGLSSEETKECACAKVRTKLAAIHDDPDKILPYICRLLSLPPEGLNSISPTEMKRETFRAMSQFFRCVTVDSLVIIIEDLHWIDDASFEMLENAVGDVNRVPVMFLLTHRPEYRCAWKGSAVATRINLRRLDAEDARMIIRKVADGELPAELEELILKKAEGMPLFTEEMTRALIEDGHIEKRGDRLHPTRPVEEISVPGTVQEVIAARVDRLGTESKYVLQVASVLGRQFRRERLIALLEGEELDVDGLLAGLESRGVIHRKNIFSNDIYRFGESLTQQVAYESLLLRQRRQLHEKVGELIEADSDQLSPERTTLLAHHYLRSDRKDKAVEALFRAAQEAEQIPAFAAAASFYREAWSVVSPTLDQAPSAEVAPAIMRAALGIGRMCGIYGVPDEGDVEEILITARRTAESIGSVETLVQLSALHGLMLTGTAEARFSEGLQIIEEAMAMAEETGRGVPEMGRALAWVYMLDGRLDSAVRAIDSAILGFSQAENFDPQSDVFLGMLFLRNRIYLISDDLEGAMQSAQHSYEESRKAGNKTVQGSSCGTIAFVHFTRRQYSEAENWARRALELNVDTGNALGRRAELALMKAAEVSQGRVVSKNSCSVLLEPELETEGEVAINVPIIVFVLTHLGEHALAENFARRCYAPSAGRLRKTIGALAWAESLRYFGETRWNDADRLFREALDTAREIGIRSFQIAAQLGLAILYEDSAGSYGQAEDLAALASECEGLGLGRAKELIENFIGESVAGMDPPAIVDQRAAN